MKMNQNFHCFYCYYCFIFRSDSGSSNSPGGANRLISSLANRRAGANRNIVVPTPASSTRRRTNPSLNDLKNKGKEQQAASAENEKKRNEKEKAKAAASNARSEPLTTPEPPTTPDPGTGENFTL